MRRCNLTSQRFGRLVALFQAESPHGETKAHWYCACDCGGHVTAASSSLRYGRTRSCGCLRRERTAECSTTHGATVNRRATSEYVAWQHAKRRCSDRRDKQFADYGGRGIHMCERWRHDFAAFLGDMGPCPPKHTLERIDVNGDYEPHNCKWATRAEQRRNTRKNIFVVLNGKRMVLKDAALQVGINPFTAYMRVRRGMTPDQALTQPIYQRW